jgi:predicted transcriptional regulator
MATITLKIPDELNAALEAVSARRRVSKSAVVRAALEEALAREEALAGAAARWVGEWRGQLRGRETPAQANDRLGTCLKSTFADRSVRLLLDINVLLDVAFQRPGEPASSTIIASCGREHEGWLAWHTLATLAYIIERQSSAATARSF